MGFVDGEGCFSCPIFRNRTMSLGWQVQPAFVVVQGESSRDVLEDLVRFFGCGRVYVNRRRDNHREDLYRYCVYRFSDLRDIIVPFFEENPLRTAISALRRGRGKSVFARTSANRFSSSWRVTPCVSASSVIISRSSAVPGRRG